MAHGAPGEVVAQEPGGQGQESYAGEANAGIIHPHGKHQSDKDQQQRPQEQLPGAAWRTQNAAQFQPLSGDGENEKTRPPQNGLMDRTPQQPDDVAQEPEPGRACHNARMQRGMLPQHDEEQGGQSQAAERDEPTAPPDDADHQGQCAGGGDSGDDVGGAPVEADDALQSDQRAQEATNHEGAVALGQARLPGG